MNDNILVVVALSRQGFKKICNDLGLNPNLVKYVHIDNLDVGLVGYYRENIFPDLYGRERPSQK